MKVAIYCRVSTQEQNLDNQKLPLIAYAERMNWEYEIFEEKESSRNTRPIQVLLYNKLLRKEFDGLLIYKFDRWARSTTELLEHIESLINKNVLIYSYGENIDLSSSMGRAMLTIISAFAQLERDLIKERTHAGLSRARAWGKVLGRHPLNCGCGKVLENGKKHNGYIIPLRDVSNKVIGWKDNRKQTPLEEHPLK